MLSIGTTIEEELGQNRPKISPMIVPQIYSNILNFWIFPNAKDEMPMMHSLDSFYIGNIRRNTVFRQAGKQNNGKVLLFPVLSLFQIRIDHGVSKIIRVMFLGILMAISGLNNDLALVHSSV